ncbi:MAG: ABC-2 family transporter protein [Tissierellia bacterium]|nr:ABC-2 family transporter protein [Tissierellia bacterium]
MHIKKYMAAMKLAEVNKKVFLFSFVSKLLIMPLSLIIYYLILYSVFTYLNIEKLGEYKLVDLFYYYFLVRIINYVNSFNKGQSYRIFTQINNGEISKFLVRPIDYIKFQLFYCIGYVKYNWLVSIPLILIVYSTFNLNDINIFIVIGFIVSLFLAMVIVFMIYSIIGVITFWTEAIFGLEALVTSLSIFLSGMILPLDLFSKPLVNLSKYLPFRYTIYEVLQIFQINEISFCLKTIRIQILWTIILYILLRLLWKFGINKYQAQGG